jgi:hypothetical protein
VSLRDRGLDDELGRVIGGLHRCLGQRVERT